LRAARIAAVLSAGNWRRVSNARVKMGFRYDSKEGTEVSWGVSSGAGFVKVVVLAVGGYASGGSAGAKVSFLGLAFGLVAARASATVVAGGVLIIERRGMVSLLV